MSHPNLFFLLKIVVVILFPLPFAVPLDINLITGIYISTKNPVIFIEIALNLSIGKFREN